MSRYILFYYRWQLKKKMKPPPDTIAKIKKVLQTGRPFASLALAYTFLNVLMNVSYSTRENDVSRLLLISPEILVILTIVSLWASLRLPFRRTLFLHLTIIIFFLCLFGIADSHVPLYFNRPFNLFLDAQFFPDLIFLLYSTLPWWLFAGWCILTVATAGFILWGVWQALKSIYEFFSGQRRRWVFSFAGVLIGVFILSHHPLITKHRQHNLAPAIFHRVAEEVDFILHFSETTESHLAAFDKAIQKAAPYQKPLKKLKGSDVYIFFIESYGHTIFADPRHTPLITPFMHETERKLQDSGYVIVSNFLQSPTYGGASWLAHGSLASGVSINSQLRYDLLLTSQVKPIAEYFNRAGYYSVSVMPGTLWPWSAGEFFKYQKKYYAFDFDYRGPKFGWAPMPDQYVINYIYRAEIQRRTQPLFIKFVLVSSHAPFNEQPHYISDWSKIGDGSIYHTLKPIEFPVIWPNLENASEAYAASLGYDFKVLVEFLAQMIYGDALIVLLGDHQPNLKITGNDQPWSVPVHVISRNPDLLKPFIRKGYCLGLIPSQPLQHAGIESLFWILLEEFSP